MGAEPLASLRIDVGYSC